MSAPVVEEKTPLTVEQAKQPECGCPEKQVEGECQTPCANPPAECAPTGPSKDEA